MPYRLSEMEASQENGQDTERTARAFLSTLRELGVELRAKDGKLQLSAPSGVVTAPIQEQLRRRKAELMAELENEADGERSAPLTFAQQRLWLIERFAPENAAYNIPQAWFVDEAIDLAVFREAIRRLTERHAALRTRIEMRDGVPVQVVLPKVDVPLQMRDLSDVAEAELEPAIQAHLQQMGREPFALNVAPLIRFQLLQLPGRRTLVAYDVHHIVADQWSLDIVKGDLAAIYVEIAKGVPAKLPALSLTYAEIAERERSAAVSRLHAEQLGYWRERLLGMPTLLELPFSRPGAQTQEYAGATLTMQLDEALTRGLRKLAARNQTTLYMVMLAAFAALLYRYTGQSDLCIGTPLTGRKLREEETVVGLFVNMLPLRCELDGAQSFEQMLKRVSGQVLTDFEHGDLPFQKLVMELHPHRSPAHSPLFQMMFALTPKAAEEEAVKDQEETFLGIAKFDLTLQVVERARALDLYLEYRTDLYSRADMEQLGRHFTQLTRSIVKAPEDAISTLPLLTDEDAAVFARWNATGLAFDRNETLVDLFERQAAATPEATALLHREEGLSYRELDAKANALASRLRALGAGPESIIGLCLERSPELIVAMLAILKAGAAYLPLDSKYPLERLKYMLEDSGARLLVAAGGRLSEELKAACPAVELVLPGDSAAEGLRANDAASARPEQAAYLIYTSGSTGKPKGVLVEHRNAVSLIAWAKSCFDAKALRGVLASTSVCFDLSVFEIFLPLATGNTIVLMQDVLELPGSPLAEQVTLVNTVPSAMSAVLQAGLPQSVNTVCMAGEFLPPELVDRVYLAGVAQAGVAQVFDLYGPTETTTYSTCVLRRVGEAATIGGPIANTRIYLLDQEQKLVPPGAAGEIYIGGEGVARGYLNRSEMTAERFVLLPEIEPNGRLYRTGDLARQRQDGALVFMGRRDQQIKLRGHRIELGEIESALREASGLTEVAVVVQGRDGGTLAAFVERAIVPAADVRMWMDALRNRLPAFMIPGVITGLVAMPRTPNGKIDRQALSQRKEAAAETRRGLGEAPRDLLEQWLANIWAYRLGVSHVTRNAHFFEDMGGHSLAAFEIFAEIEARLGVTMLLATLFQAPTVAQLAAAIRRQVWNEPKYLSLQMPAEMQGNEDRVFYLLDASQLRAASERLHGERVMRLGAVAALPMSACVAEIRSFEAMRPALVLCVARVDEGIATTLRAALQGAGFASVEISIR